VDVTATVIFVWAAAATFKEKRGLRIPMKLFSGTSTGKYSFFPVFIQYKIVASGRPRRQALIYNWCPRARSEWWSFDFILIATKQFPGLMLALHSAKPGYSPVSMAAACGHCFILAIPTASRIRRPISNRRSKLNAISQTFWKSNKTKAKLRNAQIHWLQL